MLARESAEWDDKDLDRIPIERFLLNQPRELRFVMGGSNPRQVNVVLIAIPPNHFDVFNGR
jgi:hypothetical protein